jgi:hypothetical protein
MCDALVAAFCRLGREHLSFPHAGGAQSRGAISLYQKHGFFPRRRRKNYYTHPVEDAILMSLGFNMEPETMSSDAAHGRICTFPNWSFFPPDGFAL